LGVLAACGQVHVAFQAGDVGRHLRYLVAVVLVLFVVVTREAFGVGNGHFADGLVVALVGVMQRVLRAGDGEITGGVDRQLAFRDHVGAGQGDVAGLRGHGGAAADRQLGAGHGVGPAVAGAIVVQRTDHLCGTGVDVEP